MQPALELLLSGERGRERLLAPAVGIFTRARAAGEVLVEGQECGTLLVLGREHTLLAPRGTSGRIVGPPPGRLHAPVGWGEVLYELEALVERAPATQSSVSAAAQAGLVLRSPQTGRFYHRPSPGAAAFVAAGQEIGEGTPVGLIEVMKTFTHVLHRAGTGLPARARVREYLVADGADVKQGQPLLAFEAP